MTPDRLRIYIASPKRKLAFSLADFRLGAIEDERDQGRPGRGRSALS